MEHGGAGVALVVAIDEEISRERRIDDDATIGNIELLIDERFDGSTGWIRLGTVGNEKRSRLSTRRYELRSELEALAGHAAEIGIVGACIDDTGKRSARARGRRLREIAAFVGINERVVARRGDVECDTTIAADVGDGNDDAPFVTRLVILRERKRLIR